MVIHLFIYSTHQFNKVTNYSLDSRNNFFLRYKQVFPIYEYILFSQEERRRNHKVHSNSESRTKSCVMRTQVMIKG